MNNKVPGSIMSLNQRAGVLPAKRLVSNIFLKTIQNQSWNSKTFSAFDFYCSYLRYSFFILPNFEVRYLPYCRDGSHGSYGRFRGSPETIKVKIVEMDL